MWLFAFGIMKRTRCVVDTLIQTFRPHICSRPPEEFTEFAYQTEPNGVNPAFYGWTKYQLETS